MREEWRRIVSGRYGRRGKLLRVGASVAKKPRATRGKIWQSGEDCAMEIFVAQGSEGSGIMRRKGREEG